MRKTHKKMRQLDFEGAKSYALKRLENELAPTLFYHNLEHTRDDVWPASKRLAALAGVVGEELVLLETAALYHDIGFVKQLTEHEKASANLVRETLPRFGYNLAQIEQICGMIMATKLPQTPRHLLEALLADADLDVLGREDFFSSNQKLRAELKAYGQPTTEQEWHLIQLNFLKSHTYCTAVARLLRDEQKQKNMERLKTLLRAYKEPLPR